MTSVTTPATTSKLAMRMVAVRATEENASATTRMSENLAHPALGNGSERRARISVTLY